LGVEELFFNELAGFELAKSVSPLASNNRMDTAMQLPSIFVESANKVYKSQKMTNSKFYFKSR